MEELKTNRCAHLKEVLFVEHEVAIEPSPQLLEVSLDAVRWVLPDGFEELLPTGRKLVAHVRLLDARFQPELHVCQKYRHAQSEHIT